MKEPRVETVFSITVLLLGLGWHPYYQMTRSRSARPIEGSIIETGRGSSQRAEPAEYASDQLGLIPHRLVNPVRQGAHLSVAFNIHCRLVEEYRDWLTRWFGWIPTYGEYGGLRGPDNPGEPVDSMDALFRRHDQEYEQAQGPSDIRQSDVALVEGLMQMPEWQRQQLGIYGHCYRHAAIWLFKAKVPIEKQLGQFKGPEVRELSPNIRRVIHNSRVSDPIVNVRPRFKLPSVGSQEPTAINSASDCNLFQKSFRVLGSRS